MSSRKRRGRQTNTQQQSQANGQHLEKSPRVTGGHSKGKKGGGHHNNVAHTVSAQGDHKSGKNASKKSKGQKSAAPSKAEPMFGFTLDDLKSWDGICTLLYRPADPSSLGILRFLFGLLMVLDIPQERGLGNADLKWGNPKDCHFPLFDFLQPMGLEWMCLLYLCMWIGAIGIMLGFMFRVSCTMFLVPYWYMLLLDKSSWNNHSYLYGLVAVILCASRANHYWSIDGVLKPSLSNSHVPLWNYALLRFQFFLMYFVAGLKKLDWDWVSGYSMTHLGQHWVFDPLKVILTPAQIDLWVVHFGGLLLDLTVGFWLLWGRSRPWAMVACGAFHLANAQLFTIGMFPYMCLATMPIFCRPDWPKRVLLGGRISRMLHSWMPMHQEAHASHSCCIYGGRGGGGARGGKQGKNQSNGTGKKGADTKRGGGSGNSSPVRWTHRLASILLGFYVVVQCFLPYSHFITKGYNNWTNGLYGYSWDMMVHNWLTLHAEVTVKDKETGELHFVDPEVWVQSERWNSHADMAVQYAHCLERNLVHFNLSRTEVYVDVWKSLNGRFQQRVFDPRVDLLTTEWSPFKRPEWLMPLLTHLSSWRERFKEVEDRLLQTDGNKPNPDVVFVADFPGLSLENFISKELANVTVEALEGKVVVQLGNGTNTTLLPGQKTEVFPGEFHHVHTVSEDPSCYMYVYYNATALAQAQEGVDPTQPATHSSPVHDMILFIYEKARLFERSLWFVVNSVLNLTLSVPMVKRLPVKGDAQGLKD